ncbi:GTP-binding protein, partial [Kribbella sp.]|uniref:GTP-binding protein n=1 Tax=Kribbella sp. TaxID=1871183 RepID=UPI002D65639F
MTARVKTPLSLLVGLSATLREPVLEAMTDATTVVVEVDQDELPGRGVLSWRVRDRSGPIDAGEFTVGDDCGACQLIESLVPLLETLVERAHWDHIVLSAPPAMEARPLVTTLVSVLPEIAVDTVTCVVDAVLLVAQLSGDELLAERGLALGLPDRRNVAELTARQIEYADVCVLANAHRGASPERLEHLLGHLNPRTEVVPAGGSGVPDGQVARTGRFDFDAAEAWAGELATSDRLQPSDDGVTTVLWRSTRPLHPARLNDALEDIVHGVVR